MTKLIPIITYDNDISDSNIYYNEETGLFQNRYNEMHFDKVLSMIVDNDDKYSTFIDEDAILKILKHKGLQFNYINDGLTPIL